MRRPMSSLCRTQVAQAVPIVTDQSAIIGQTTRLGNDQVLSITQHKMAATGHLSQAAIATIK